MNKRLSFFMAVSLLLLAGIGCASTADLTAVPSAAPSTQTAPAGTQGRAVISITDDEATLAGVTSVLMTIDKVETHSSAQGWLTVSSASKKYDLLRLRQTGGSELLVDVKLDAGTYDQIRLNVSNVSVTADGKTQTAKLPSSTLKIVGDLVVIAGQTSTLSLDFMLDKSLHLTGTGLYVLAPVIKLESRSNASVDVKADGTVEESGGKLEDEDTEGMDVDGEVRSNFELREKLEVDGDGKVKIRIDD